MRLHEKLSEDSIFLPLFQSLKLSRRIAHERLTRVCLPSIKNREMALVADFEVAEPGTTRSSPWGG